MIEIRIFERTYNKRLLLVEERRVTDIAAAETLCKIYSEDTAYEAEFLYQVV